MPALHELIDRFVPLHTRASVQAMRIAYAKQITDLLGDIWQMQMQLDDAYQHISKIEREYADTFSLRVPLGSITAHTERSPYQMVDVYAYEWRPEPRRAFISMNQPINREEYPLIFNAVVREFKKDLTDKLIPELTRQYERMYLETRRR